MKKATCTVVALIFLCSLAAAGEVIGFSLETTRGDEAPVESGVVRLDGDKLSMSATGVEGGSFIFRGDRDLVYVVDHSRKAYTEIDRKMMQDIGSKMDEAMAQLEKQLENMPEERRKMLRDVMKGRMGNVPGAGGASEPEPATLKKTSDKKTIDGYPCVKYEVWRGDEKTRELWVTPWEKLDYSKQDFQVFEGVQTFFESMSGSLKSSPFASRMENPFEMFNELDGFPVLIRRTLEGGRTEETRIRSLGKVATTDGAFEPPGGYTRNDPMRGSMGGRGR